MYKCIVSAVDIFNMQKYKSKYNEYKDTFISCLLAMLSSIS